MKTVITILLLFIAILYIQSDVSAQCAMCKATIESNEEGIGGGINNGILYMMAIPYLLICGVGYFIYKNYKKTSNQN